MLISPPPRFGSGAVESAYVLLDALAAGGLKHLVLAPGSRSAPLVYAAHALNETWRSSHGADLIELHVRHDERAAAFTALGLSRAGELAAVGTTSGTAAAHLLAAAMEAHHSSIPLLLLTADRPAELRGTGANQSTHQPGLFEPFAALSVDLPAATAKAATDSELRLYANTAVRATASARHTPGPVHLNLGFRDPLTLTATTNQAGHTSLTATDLAGHTSLTRREQRFAGYEPAARTGIGLELSARTVIVAGDGYESGHRAQQLAKRLNLPLLAEPSSNARAHETVLIPAYPHVVSAVMADSAHELRPEMIVVFGHPTLSRPVMRDLLGAPHVEIIVESASLMWPDAPRNATRVVELIDPLACTLAASAATLDPRQSTGCPSRESAGDPLPTVTRSGASCFLAGWQEMGKRCRSELAANIDPQAQAALAVWNVCAKERATLVLGASSLVRDLEVLAGASAATIHANRGLAGIDGTVSMASGIALAQAVSTGVEPCAQGAAKRTRVLLGDITAIHDLTGCVLGPLEREPHLDIVIVDDNGGRIFSGLEHKDAPAGVLTRFFTTPHGIDLAGVLEACGIQVSRVVPSELSAALSASSQSSGRRAFLVSIHS